jgi:hypothetical protein
VEQTDLVTLVSQVLAIASERGDEPIRILCEQLGQRLVAEAEPKEVVQDKGTVSQPELHDKAEPPVQGEPGAEILALKAQLNEARLRLTQWALNPDATKCPECIKRKAQNVEAQKKWREKKVKRGKKVNSRSKGVVGHA